MTCATSWRGITNLLRLSPEQIQVGAGIDRDQCEAARVVACQVQNVVRSDAICGNGGPLQVGHLDFNVIGSGKRKRESPGIRLYAGGLLSLLRGRYSELADDLPEGKIA